MIEITYYTRKHFKKIFALLDPTNSKNILNTHDFVSSRKAKKLKTFNTMKYLDHTETITTVGIPFITYMRKAACVSCIHKPHCRLLKIWLKMAIAPWNDILSRSKEARACHSILYINSRKLPNNYISSLSRFYNFFIKKLNRCLEVNTQQKLYHVYNKPIVYVNCYQQGSFTKETIDEQSFVLYLQNFNKVL